MEMVLPNLGERVLCMDGGGDGLLDVLEVLAEDHMEVVGSLAAPPNLEFDIQVFLLKNIKINLSGTNTLYDPPPESVL
ncbi:MAG TPA: hypothetical protein PKA53_08965 [Sphingobacterium sp.]|nr:hypothetical protein [Sphingobacterium sp.]